MRLLLGWGRRCGGLEKIIDWVVRDIIPDAVHRSWQALPPPFKTSEEPAVRHGVDPKRDKTDVPVTGISATFIDEIGDHSY